MKHKPNVSVIGLGNMGAALAEAFLKKGYPTTVWNRSVKKADELVAKGALQAQTVVEAVTASTLIVVCVLDYQVMHNIFQNVGDNLSGRVLVNLTNGTPKQARQTAEWASNYGANYIDGGIMAIPSMISQNEALLLYSGSKDSFEQNREYLDSLGTSMFLGTDPGLASLYDLGLLSAMYGMFAGFFHSLALVKTEEVKATEFTKLVLPWMGAMMEALPSIAEEADSNNHKTEVSNLNVNQRGLTNIVDASREQGMKSDLMIPLLSLIEQAVKQGHGEDGLSILIPLLKEK